MQTTILPVEPVIKLSYNLLQAQLAISFCRIAEEGLPVGAKVCLTAKIFPPPSSAHKKNAVRPRSSGGVTKDEREEIKGGDRD